MKVDFDAPLLDLDDKPIRTTEKDDTPATLLLVTKLSLNADGQDPPEKKLKCFDLLMLIRKGGTVEILPEQAALIKEKIGAMYTPVIYGRACTMLNG